MAPMVCRLKYRKGQPLGLTTYPGPTFSSLSLEIRNQVYKHLLVASEPLVIYDTPPDDLIYKYNDGRYTKLPPLTFGLLRVNKSIATEAAAILYHHNTFAFRATEEVYDIETWDVLYSFLLSIGATNRTHLRYIEGAMSKPRQVMQGADGTLTTFASAHRWLRRVHARDQHPRIYSPDGPHSTVDLLPPAIEAVFRILGPDGSKLRLSLIVEHGCLPGATAFDDLQGISESLWSLEVSDHIESMKKRFTSKFPDDDDSRVEILWKGSALKAEFDVEVVTNLGWELVELEEKLRPLGPLGPSNRWSSTVLFILRRKIAQNLG